MKIIKMSVDTFWKGEVRVQGQIEDETKVYQTRIFIKGSQIYDYSCSCAEGNSFRGPCVHAKALQEAFARQQKAEHTLPVSTSPEIRMMIREYTNREVARILGEEEREPVYLHPYLQIRRGEVLLEARIGREKRYIVKTCWNLHRRFTAENGWNTEKAWRLNTSRLPLRRKAAHF